ncbi:hypothetical protein GOP47_0024818 [Adiantum capillus-veneris]|uniref:Uncharacterized protein n=1 Tax=Adiantum capillus-veneris TaxID=13818 RepID=A0A9D4Z2Z6_ADICA|nr:hypothetical protein GOP47_0024818 [Adiantum capillus-veneris]
MKDKSKLASSSPCSALKTAYNECFNKWYAEKFLKGQWEKDECLQEWEAYRACVLKRMEDRKLHHLFKMEAMLHAKEED